MYKGSPSGSSSALNEQKTSRAVGSKAVLAYVAMGGQSAQVAKLAKSKTAEQPEQLLGPAVPRGRDRYG